MKYIWKQGIFIIAVLVVGFSLFSCEHDDDNTTVPKDSYSSLDDAIYMPIEDEAQPVWLQALIAKDPYLKVFRSENGGGMFIVEAPLKDSELSFFDSDGTSFPTPAGNQLMLTVQNGQPWTLTHIYTYPIKPGDSEWDFERYTIGEIQAKLQLPAELLHGMNTADLLETSLDFACFSDFAFYDEWQRGVDAVRNEFNGYAELFRRKDLVKTMFGKYEIKMRTAELMDKQEILTQGSYSIRFMLFKMLLAQDEILNQLNREQLRQLIRLSMEANKMVQSYPELFGTIHYIPVFYLYSRIIVHEGGFDFESDEEKAKVGNFAETCTFDPKVTSVFTAEFQTRMNNYLMNL